MIHCFRFGDSYRISELCELVFMSERFSNKELYFLKILSKCLRSNTIPRPSDELRYKPNTIKCNPLSFEQAPLYANINHIEPAAAVCRHQTRFPRFQVYYPSTRPPYLLCHLLKNRDTVSISSSALLVRRLDIFTN